MDEQNKKTAAKENVAYPPFLYLTASVAVGIILAGILQRSAADILIPFGAAYVAARILRPAGLFVSRACHVNRKVGCTAFSLILCFGAVYAAGTFSGKLISELSGLLRSLPDIAADVSDMIKRLGELLPLKLDGKIAEYLSAALNEAASYAASFAASFLGGMIGALPGGVFSTFAGVTAFIYLMADMEGASESMKSLIPKRISKKTVDIFAEVSGAVFSYLRAYLIIMTVTFFELTVGFILIGAKNPLALAFIIAVIDILPVLGCGTVIIPWAIWELIYGEISFAVGLLVILAVLGIVRRFIEPKLIGKASGVHSFVALLCIYAGWQIGGVPGMLIAPIVLMALQSIRKSKLFSRKESYERELAGQKAESGQ